MINEKSFYCLKYFEFLNLLTLADSTTSVSIDFDFFNNVIYNIKLLLLVFITL